MTELYKTIKTVFVEDILEDIANKKKKEDIKRFNYACSWGFYNEVKGFIQSGMDVNAVDENGRTPLINACSYGDNKETAELLIQNGAEINASDIGGWTPLMHACNSKEANTVALLLNNGADANAKSRNGFTPLSILLKGYNYPDANLVKLLLDHGADANAKDDQGKTPLMIAKEKGYNNIANLLSSYGATE